MNCNEDIHNYLKESEVVCPFCDQQIDFSRKPKDDKCCNNQDIINDNSMQICKSCGIVHRYNYVKEYVNFYDNRHKFIRKSVYHRKYHINNHIMKLQDNYGIQLSNLQKHKIDEIYNDIGSVIRLVDSKRKRKRMISINFIMTKIFHMMGIPFDNIPITECKKTLKSYKTYWSEIYSLKGDDIKKIIMR